MYRIFSVISILMFTFLILVFYPDTVPMESLNNVIYITNAKSENVRKALQIVVSEDYKQYPDKDQQGQQTGTTDYMWPLDYGVGQITSVLGYRSGVVHKGWDISTMKVSRPLYSIADGTVIRTGISGTLNSGFGYICCVQYTDNSLGEFMVIYPHMREATNLKVGQKVKKGEIIGYTGTTGSSTGIHLHFQIGPVHDYTNYYNPLRLLYNMDMTKSDIEAHYGLTFQPNALNSVNDQNLNKQKGIDTLLKEGWGK